MSVMGGVTAGKDLEVGALIKENDRYLPVDDHGPADDSSYHTSAQNTQQQTA